MLALCLLTMGQSKLTPDALMSLQRMKAKVERTAAKAKGMNASQQEQQLVTLVVKVSGNNAAETFAKMKAAGATICSRLGQQTVIRIPVDCVPALESIPGVVRIGKGHKGHLKTDVSRRETQVDQLNGPLVQSAPTIASGKGVNICLVDVGFDFQHAAFRDAEGRSRIKCVYMMGDDGGHPFTVNDPEAGEVTFPGSVYDTPELIATLTTDDEEEYHGTHTAGIAAGSITPQGFGGMAPDANLVLVPLQENDNEYFADLDAEEYMELAIAFAVAYAEQSDLPTVLSVSANDQAGPHDGTSTVTEAIEEASTKIIPVFSAGNEGGYPVHLYQKFTAAKPSVNTILLGLLEDESGEYEYLALSEIAGFTRKGSEASIQLKLMSINQFTGRLTAVWSSEVCTATIGCEETIKYTSSEEDEVLAKYFDGEVAVGAVDMGDGKLSIAAMVDGGMKKLYLFQLIVGGAEGTEIDVWDNIAGFGGVEYIGLPGLVDGDSEMSGGDWTCTNRAISVGAYCANILNRYYDGTVLDTSVVEDDEDYVDEANAIAWFSSYGTSFNGIDQPTVCAPGVNVVSSLNHYAIDEDETVAEEMQWQGYPYIAESGTSMACPTVAGIIALWLEVNPSMTLDDVKDVLEHTSVNDSYTATTPIRWGFGKIDAKRGVDYITTTAIRTVESSNPRTSVYFDLSGRRINGKPAPGVYIHQGHKVVVK